MRPEDVTIGEVKLLKTLCAPKDWLVSGRCASCCWCRYKFCAELLPLLELLDEDADVGADAAGAESSALKSMRDLPLSATFCATGGPCKNWPCWVRWGCGCCWRVRGYALCKYLTSTAAHDEPKSRRPSKSCATCCAVLSDAKYARIAGAPFAVSAAPRCTSSLLRWPPALRRSFTISTYVTSSIQSENTK